MKSVAAAKLAKIFSEEILSSANWAEGIYRPRRRPCTVPRKQALVLANGDVHPCNMVEYVHEPIMGNLFEQSLTALWRGADWKHFRESLHRIVRFAPCSTINSSLSAATTNGSGPARSLLHKVRLERMNRYFSERREGFFIPSLSDIIGILPTGNSRLPRRQVHSRYRQFLLRTRPDFRSGQLPGVSIPSCMRDESEVSLTIFTSSQGRGDSLAGDCCLPTSVSREPRRISWPDTRPLRFAPVCAGAEPFASRLPCELGRGEEA